jgi:hypothetical protein
MFLKKYIFGILLVVLLLAQFIFWFGIPPLNETEEQANKRVEVEGINPYRFEKDKSHYIWRGTRSQKPDMYVVPPVPSEEILRAFAFGDEQLYFRYNAYVIQFAGDTFGRTTALKDYDYNKLYEWWTILDRLDSNSDYLPYMVSYYYGATQDPERQIGTVIDFLEQHSDKNPSKKWWWYSQAAYHARYKLKDDKRAMGIADKLYNLPKELDIPIWTRQLKAFIFEKEGEYKQSCEIIVNVLKDYQDGRLEEGEINFIHYFIQERLRKMIEAETTIDKADISPECRQLMKMQYDLDKKNSNVKKGIEDAPKPKQPANQSMPAADSAAAPAGSPASPSSTGSNSAVPY